MNCNEYPISEPRSRDQSSSLWPANSGGVRFIDDELGSISFRKHYQIRNGCAVAIHTENAFADDKFLWGAGLNASQLSFERIHIEVGEN